MLAAKAGQHAAVYATGDSDRSWRGVARATAINLCNPLIISIAYDMQTTALVTGASSGIGWEFAHVLAQHGHNVILVARSSEKLETLSEELKKKYCISAEIIVLDLSQQSAPTILYETIQHSNRTVDILINNAGFGTHGLFHETDWNTEAAMIDLNVRALTELTKLFLPSMLQRHRGYIVNVASTAAFQPGPLMSVYYATKAYVLSFSEAIANELRGSGVTVTALCPGPTTSGFQKVAGIENTPMVLGKRLPTSREVAEYGYRAMKAGKVVAIHGTLNALMAFGIKLIPRALASTIVRKIQDKRR